MDWKRIREIFERALDLEPAERHAFVREACGDDEALRGEVEAMLAAHERPGGFLSSPAAVASDVLAAARDATGTSEAAGVRDAAAPRAAHLAAGTVVDGKYRVDGLLGAGGMGAVYRAWHLQLERAVALKAIRGELLSQPTAAERFRREAVAVARLRHPHIVAVYDYGVSPDAGAYLVMELLEGRSLREELAERGPLEPERALAVVAQTCAAVGAAHRAGVVHRDLKPDNIFLERRDGSVSVKVVDFGVARLEAVAQTGSGALTAEGVLLGTPLYMSPEQCRGEESDARSDVYSLGCVFYEMLTGERPFAGKSVFALVYQHVNEEPRRPREVAPELAPEVEAALLRALAKDPAERFQSAEALAEALGAAGAAPSLGGAAGAAGTLGGIAPVGDDAATPVEVTPVPAVAPAGAAPGGVTPAAAAGPSSDEATVIAPLAPRAPAHNLPHSVTSFVGRERQIDEVLRWLGRARLVTLVGPGGIGKTRLALETAARAVGEYLHGVWLVELASLADPALVPRAVGSALGVPDLGGRPEAESVEGWLRDKHLLLVLDNCEHVIEASARLVERLLAASAGLRVLATSREPLAIAGEAAWRVPALALPAPGGGHELESEAARLFAERAALARPGFELTEAEAPAVAELCRRLEGIPLAIELAAARVRALTVEQVLQRVDDRFRLLAFGSRVAPTRQQTLRATLDWSYDLLNEQERELLERLGVFAGGWTLEMAEEVVGQTPDAGRQPADAGRRPPASSGASSFGTGSGDLTTFDLLFRLVDKSLVVAQDRGPDGRFRMLEVVREYALERLRESGAADEVFRRHAEAFVTLAKAASDGFVGTREAEWLERLEAEHDNLRAALGWLLENDPERCLFMVDTLAGFWSLRGHFAEGLRWLTAALERGDPSPSLLRVRVLRGAGELAWRRGDLGTARARLEESMRIAREVGDARQIAWSAFHLALIVQQQGDARGSRPYLEESLAHARTLGDDRLIGNALNSLGEAARIEGDWEAARPYFEESLETHGRVGHTVGMSLTLCNLGAALCESGDLDAARACYVEAAPRLREQGNAMGLSLAIDGLAAVAAKRGEWERAARLAGAAAALRDGIGGELEPADRALRERCLEAVREHLDAAALEAATAEGRAAARGGAIDDALA